MTTQRVVYTALFGGYEALVEQPVAAESDVPFICFTDDPTLTSESWQIRVVDPVLPTDPVRSARHLKLIGDDEIRGFAESLWIDNSVALAVDPTSVLDAWLQSDSIAMPLHSYRRSVIAEFQEILLMGLDDPTRIYEQLAHYSLTYASTLDAVPIWTALIARRHGEQSDRFGRVWRDHVFRYSRRDQLSVRVAQQVSGASITEIEIDNRESWMHRWPVSQGRPSRPAQFRVSDMLQPPIARIGQMQRELDDVTLHYSQAVDDREQRIRELEQAIEDILGSRSWKALGVVRRARAVFAPGA